MGQLGKVTPDMADYDMVQDWSNEVNGRKNGGVAV